MAPKIPLSELPAFLSSVSSEIEKSLATGVLTAAQVLAGDIAETIISTANKAPHPANIRTGALARSFLEGTRFVGAEGGKVKAATTSRLVYARIQDEGGFIRPRQRQNLSIPLSMEAARRWPRDWPKGSRGLFLIKSRAGNLLLAKRRGRGIEPMYVLKKQVRLDGRQYLSIAKEKAAPKLGRLMADAAIEPFRKGRAG